METVRVKPYAQVITKCFTKTTICGVKPHFFDDILVK